MDANQIFQASNMLALAGWAALLASPPATARPCPARGPRGAPCQG